MTRNRRPLAGAPSARTASRLVAVFFVSTLLLLSSGRIASSDAGAQLQVAVLLATTGQLGLEGPDAPPDWAVAPSGRKYQVHDLGNALIMLPGAAAGAWLSGRSAPDLFADPPVISRVSASLLCALMAALTSIWMFHLFAMWHPPRTAFLLAVLMPAATILIAYARSAWDVMGACCFMAGALRYSASTIRDGRRSHAIAAAACLALACTFRFSLVPFFAPAGLYLLWRCRAMLAARAMVQSALVFALVLLPSLAYNSIRTGAPWRPATTTSHLLAGQNAMTNDIASGVYGLLLSPNRGLFIFSPLLILIVAMPFLWKRLDSAQRTLLGTFGIASGGYVLMIASLQNWGTFGWGPRYMMPVLPVLFCAAAFAIAGLWRKWQPAIVMLALVSCAASVPPALVNWHLATSTFPHAAEPWANRPYQQLAAWKTLAMGLRGEDLPVPPDAAQDPARRTTASFPDLLLARIARTSRTGFALATAVTALGLWIAVWAAVRLLARDASNVRAPTPSRLSADR